MKMYAICVSLLLISLSTAFAQSNGPRDQQARDWQHQFQLSSTTFTNGSQLPLSMILSPTYCIYASGWREEFTPEYLTELSPAPLVMTSSSQPPLGGEGLGF